MKNIFTVILALFITTNVLAQNEVIIRIDHAQSDQLEMIKNKKLEITAYQEGSFLDVQVSPQQYQELLEEGWKVYITQSHEQNKINLNPQKDIVGYRTYDEVLAELQQIAIDYPEICTLTDIADSHGKEYFDSGIAGYEDYQHDIWMLKISDQVNDSEDEPAVYFMGAHHSREPISTEVVMGIINHLTSKYGVDDAVTNMVNEAEIYIIPMVNPDGHEIVLDQLNTNWRKNAADGDGNGVLNYNSGSVDGVDPNRNYGWEFGGDGSSGDQTAETYRGPSAFSEPETAAMRDLLATHHFTTGISYHSYSELVLWPYAYSASSLAPDHEALEELGVNMAESIPRIIGSGHYTPEQSNDLYPASGVTDDWAYGKHGIFCYTVELGQEFIPPSPQVPNIVADNIDAAMMVLNRANHQTLRGHVYDAETLEPLVAEIYDPSMDDLASYREAYKSNAAFGSYYRLFPVGSRSITYSSYGYISQSISDIEIIEEEATILDVYLEKAAMGPIFGSVIDGNTGENIEGAEIQILNTPLLPVFTNAEGIYEIDEVAYNTYTIRVDKEGYAPLYIDQNIDENHHILNFVLLPSEAITFEEGEFGEEFNMSGQLPWVIDENIAYEGDYSSASGDIGDNQSSSMTIQLEDRSAGIVSFYKKVSTESGYDMLEFYIDGVKQNSWSGEIDWSPEQFPVPEGDHQVKWTYKKDSNTTNGSDKTWIDFIEIPPILTTVVNAGPDQEICEDETVQLNAYAANYETVLWASAGDGSFSDEEALNCSYSPGPNDILNGTVDLSITANGSGTATDEMSLLVETCLGINDHKQNPKFSLSPNPANDWLMVSFTETNTAILEIYNMSGALIQSIHLNESQEGLKIDLSSFNSGVYVLKLSEQTGAFSVQRFIVN